MLPGPCDILCRSLLTEMEERARSQPMPVISKTVWHWFFLPLVLVLALFLCTPAKQPRHPSSALLQDLYDQLEGFRPGEGRLAEVRHSPYSLGRGENSLGERARIAIRDVVNRCRDASEECTRVRVSVLLLDGKIQQAIDLLEIKISKKENPRILTDLAVAYLMRSVQTKNPVDLILSLGASSRALSHQPPLLEARFNQALALEKLHLNRRAATTWKEFLEHEVSEPWINEARAHLARVERKRGTSEAPSVLEILRWSEPEVADLVRRSPQDMRLLAEENLLGLWAEAVLRDDESRASSLLEAAWFIGATLAQETGDRLLLETVDSIRSASLGQRTSLVKGCQSFQEGVFALQSDRYAVAARSFGAASLYLQKAGAPLWRLATANRAIAEYYQQQFNKSLVSFNHAVAGASPNHYLTLFARTAWMRGVVRFVTGDTLGALLDHSEAERYFQRAREGGHLGFMKALLASDHHRLGDREAEWKYRMDALSSIDDLGGERRVYTVLRHAALAALEEGEPEAALEFLEELVSRLNSSSAHGVLAETLGQMALVRKRLGSIDAALDNVELAQVIAAKIADAVFRERIAIDLTVVKAELLSKKDPRLASALLGSALDYYRGTKYRVGLVKLLQQKAGAQRQAKDFAKAAEDLEEALSEVARVEKMLSPERQNDSTELKQNIFDQMILMALDRESHSDSFEMIERARLSALGDWSFAASAVPSVRLVQKRLGSDEAIIEFALFDEITAVWVVTRDKVTFALLPLTTVECEELLARLRRSLQDPRDHAIRELQVLGRHLLGPILPSLSAAKRLIIIPDKLLARVPFSALIVPGTSSFLIETHQVVVSPSATLYIQNTRRGVYFKRLPRVLAVAVSHFGGILPGLPGAEREARIIASLYPNGRVLEGEQTLSTILAEARGRDVLHVATHTIAELERSSGIRLAFSGDKHFPVDQAGLPEGSLDGVEVVILAACNSAQGDARMRTKNLGISGEFLRAGVSIAMGSLWKVEDKWGLRFSKALHERISKGEEPTQALWRTQLQALRGTHQGDRHPARWAAFQAVVGLRIPRTVQ